MRKVMIFRNVQILDSNPITSLDYSQEKFFSQGILEFKSLTLEKKEYFCKCLFFGIRKNLEYSFLSEHLKKSICNGVFSSVIGYIGYIDRENIASTWHFYFFFLICGP